MKKSTDTLPPEIREELERTRPLTPAMLQSLARANRRLESDPAFQADFLKMSFVNAMLTALEERGDTKAQLADRLGKSRQYVQKLFDEDRRINFTVDTLCSVAHSLGRRIHLHVCKAGEEPMILTAIQRRRVVSSVDDWVPPRSGRSPANLLDQSDFKESSPASMKGVANVDPIAA